MATVGAVVVGPGADDTSASRFGAEARRCGWGGGAPRHPSTPARRKRRRRQEQLLGGIARMAVRRPEEVT